MALAFTYWLDLLALAVFLGGWMLYGRTADNYKDPKHPSLLTVMHRLRIKWLTEMQMRTLRMPDVMTLTIATSNYTFFASTSILIIAGAFTLFIGGTEWRSFIGEIPTTDINSLELTPLKLLVLVLIFIYSFFKFTWSIRQVGYCAILLGSIENRYNAEDGAPPSAEEYKTAQKRAQLLAPVFTLAGNNFNYGLRAYYFGLAMLPWFISPLWLIFSSLMMIIILSLREFNSKTLVALLRVENELDKSED